MQRSSFPAAETTVSRIKSLVIALDAAHGAAAGDAVLAAVHLTRADLANETRPIGVTVWKAALEAVAEAHGRDAIGETWRGVVDESNLGVWMRVLRGTTEPGAAYKQLDGFGGDEAKTTRWETLDAHEGSWRGRVSVRHDPRLEVDGLLHLARIAELRAIPVLYGLGPADVETVSLHRATFASQTGAAGQEFHVTWVAAKKRRYVPVASVLGGVVGLSAAFRSFEATIASTAVGALVGAGVGLLIRRSQRRKTEEHAQRMRLTALERSTTLRDESQTAKASGGREEGSVVAGMYRLGPCLGSGANGVVHAAEKLEGAVPVAVKFLRAAVAHDAVATDRLRREAEAMGLAWHPNVVDLVDQGVLPDGSLYLVMEKLEGETLAARIARSGRLSPEEIAPIALQLCDALGAVHAAGVIHRDVKPSNVYLMKDESGGLRVKLFDFGIARVEWAETRLTQPGATVGTPGYMAPEQQRGQEVDARADVYALGEVVLEALTGTAPALPSPDPVEQAARTSSGVVRSAVPATWRAIIDRATAQLPRSRFPDARSMRDAIAAASRGEAADVSGT